MQEGQVDANLCVARLAWVGLLLSLGAVSGFCGYKKEGGSQSVPKVAPSWVEPSDTQINP